VCALGGVQLPTLYHFFGDKQGLMQAVVDNAFDRYLTRKARVATSARPADNLRRGWDLHVGFARTHTGIYPLMYPAAGPMPDAAVRSEQRLRAGFDELAAQGCLRPGVTAAQAAKTLGAALHGVALAVVRDPRSASNTVEHGP
jgi:AcrR family transcriptional regulator